MRDLPDRPAWEAALERGRPVDRACVGPHRGGARAREVVFPAESAAEKEGTVVHPDGRVQRLRDRDRPPPRGARRLVGDRRAREPGRPDLGVETQRRWRSRSSLPRCRSTAA